jgi:hypothetical protein
VVLEGSNLLSDVLRKSRTSTLCNPFVKRHNSPVSSQFSYISVFLIHPFLLALTLVSKNTDKLCAFIFVLCLTITDLMKHIQFVSLLSNG